MGKDSKKKKRIRTYALLSAAAVLAVALGVLLGGKISGVLFSGQDLFNTDDRTVRATPLPTASPFVPVAAPSIDATEVPVPESCSPTMIEDTPQPTQTPGPYEELIGYYWDKDREKAVALADTAMKKCRSGMTGIMVFLLKDYLD